jgi:mRNA interferase RelE/StbE
MSYELRFKEEALAEWRRLDGSLREQFKKKLIEPLQEKRLLMGSPAPGYQLRAGIP